MDRTGTSIEELGTPLEVFFHETEICHNPFTTVVNFLIVFESIIHFSEAGLTLSITTFQIYPPSDPDKERNGADLA